MLAKRRQIDCTEREIAAKAAAKLLCAHPLFAASTHIASYFALDNEFDTAPLIHEIFNAKKLCYLPVLKQDKSLNFVHYAQGDKLQLNRLQILEPVNEKVFPAQKLDLVLLPLVAFDQQGNRLGQGGGYYDRTFSFVKSAARENLFLLGVGYENQRVEDLSSDIWDVKLDGVLTEHRLIIFNRHILATTKQG